MSAQPQHTTSPVDLCVPGRIAGKGRPRAFVVAGKARMHTPAATKAAEARVREVWATAGRPYLGDGPLQASIVLYEQRPKGHWTSKGSLSATGRRSVFPVRKPDLDNAAKLVLDSLNGCLYRDDAQIARLSIMRMWLVDAAAPEFADVTIGPLPGVLP